MDVSYQNLKRPSLISETIDVSFHVGNDLFPIMFAIACCAFDYFKYRFFIEKLTWSS
jgi:hypothetical protein